MKKLDKYDSDRYITTETVVECKTKEILEIQSLTVVNMIQLVGLFKEIDFDNAINMIDKQYLELVFDRATNQDILDCIPSLALNALDEEVILYSLERLYMSKIEDITWTSVLTCLTLIGEVLDREEDLVEAIKEAHRIAMEKSTVRYR